MKHCEKCNIDLKGELDQCPLCQAELAGTAVPSVFPRNEAKKTGELALKILAFVTGLSLAVTVFLWLLLSLPGDIILIICLALVINYLYIRNVLIHRPDFLRVIVRYFLILLVLAVAWFIFTQNLIITTYVIPSIGIVALVFDAVLIVLFRGTFVSGYAKYLLFSVLLGLAPLILAAAHLTTTNILVYICALVAIILALALLVFTRKQLVTEIRKLFSA